MAATAAKQAKKKRAFKPSTLLRWALEILTEGHWLQGALHQDAGDEVNGNFNTKTKKGEYGEDILKTEGWCMVGVCNHVNTPNQNLAKKFLALAIAQQKVKDGDLENDEIEQSAFEFSKKGAEDTIINFNDDCDTEFSDVRRTFKKAIKLAQKAGM